MVMPTLLRFRDLVKRQVVKDYRDLKRKVEEEGFPPGRMIGPRSRIWTDEETCSWLETRPSYYEAKPPLRGGAKRNAERAGKASQNGREN